MSARLGRSRLLAPALTVVLFLLGPAVLASAASAAPGPTSAGAAPAVSSTEEAAAADGAAETASWRSGSPWRRGGAGAWALIGLVIIGTGAAFLHPRQRRRRD